MEYQELRRSVIDLVLETDIVFHFEFVTRFRMRRQVSPFFKVLAEKSATALSSQSRTPVSFRSRTRIAEDTDEDVRDLWAIAKACIRGADIGYALTFQSGILLEGTRDAPHISLERGPGG